jgi:hypothetical protein
LELTVFGGQTLPTYEQRLRIGLPSLPPAPGLEVTGGESLVVEAQGGPSYGAALAIDLVGPLGLEARVDVAKIDLGTEGVAYRLVQSLPAPLPSLRGSMSVGAGTVSFDRYTTASLNLRLQTPGAMALFVSGGVSYLKSPRARGRLPVRLEVEGVPVLPGASAEIALSGDPSQPGRRLGVNAGAGARLRLGETLSLLADVRVFAFGEHEFRFEVTTQPSVPELEALVSALDVVRLQPTHFHGVLGLCLSF